MRCNFPRRFAKNTASRSNSALLRGKEKASELLCSEAFIGSGGRDRTYDLVVNSHPLYR
jgi:hypothetical protein